ncbi:hypothetical protein [Nitratidesulfovibrio vulgaris]|uniref:Putative phage protein n=1 Tax=Nitratidesulfovibrio vulgaris (strain DP4) TaxID=391774 RepID=A0A0H3A9A7_NITV4|nr:hypothetical protein [Nitratidesulfovibrio vulgaris]ABM28097.1 putative phage protein [Nitratidesulfovibrio vulgaris DP4]
MAYEIGTATDYKDLLAKLKTFVTTNAALVAAGQQWTVMRHTAPASGDHELILRGPGLAGADQIYVGIKTEAVSNGGRNWQLNGFTGYDSPASFEAQPGGLAANLPRLLLLDAGMPYWFFANGRRIIVVARASTTYQIAYLGFIMPYGPPAGLPYPMFVGGCACTASVWSDSLLRSNAPFFCARNDAPSSSIRPTSSSGYFMTAGWKCLIEKQYYYNNWYANFELFVLPHSGLVTTSTGYKMLALLRPNVDNSFPLIPMTLCASGTARNVYGEFDGMFGLPGIGVAAEDIVTISGQNFLVFSGGALTGRNNFVAIRMD